MNKSRRCCRLGAALLSLLLAGGCMMAARRNVKEIQRLGVIAGAINYASSEPVIVAALQGERQVAVYAHRYRSGAYVLRVRAGVSYDVAAFADRNDNLRLDDGEPAVLYPERVTANAEATVRADFALTDKQQIAPAAAAALKALRREQGQALAFAEGEVADLSDIRFSREAGEKGLFRPFDFLVEEGIGVYFLEEYDAQRIPVLFVNGAGGSPQDWAPFIQRLDRGRYQPWVFLYPSGLSLERSARELQTIVGRLHGSLGFERLCVTAHSMGGLVARRFLVRSLADNEHGYAKIFITLSTPWQGHAAASFGVERSPIVLPSWEDMVPDSDFQKSVFESDLRGRIPAYLLFSYHGGSPLVPGNNDGAVSLASQLFPNAQREALMIYGFDESHASILKSEEVFDVWQKLVRNAWGGSPGPAACRGPGVAFEPILPRRSFLSARSFAQYRCCSGR